MAIYSGRMSLGAAIAAPLAKPIDGELWPTVVVDELGATLGLVWSTRQSIEAAVAERRGIYWSRSRDELWTKGASSGNTQDLLDSITKKLWPLGDVTFIPGHGPVSTFTRERADNPFVGDAAIAGR